VQRTALFIKRNTSSKKEVQRTDLLKGIALCDVTLDSLVLWMQRERCAAALVGEL
jgi:hypothetical protein